MNQKAVCPKCKSCRIKVIEPNNEITFICEKCGFMKKLGNTILAKRLHDTEMFFINCLSIAFTKNKSEIGLEDLIKIKLERFTEIMKESRK